MTLRKIKIIAAVLIVLLVALAALIWYLTFFSAKPTTEVSESTTQSEVQNKFAMLKGEAFDEVYIADMIAHHEGAVAMAEQAQAVAAHPELKMLAGTITQTQSVEIATMRQWQQDWGYEIASGAHGGEHGSMQGGMSDMQEALTGLSGEAFDKEFLKQMIAHHEQAVEMSEFAEENAGHQEVKDLAKAIIAAQTQEIDRMKRWQIDWYQYE